MCVREQRGGDESHVETLKQIEKGKREGERERERERERRVVW